MSLKNIVGSIIAMLAFSSFALAQAAGGGSSQPNQPRRDADGMGRGDGRGFGRAFGRPGPGMMGRGGMDFGRLNLTDAQKQRIQALLETQRRLREGNRAQFEEMGRLMQLKRQGLLTTEQGTRLTSLEAQMKTNADRMQSELMAILTPEQRTLADQMKNERFGGRMRGMREGGGGRRMRLPMRPGVPSRPGRPGMPPMPPPPPTDN